MSEARAGWVVRCEHYTTKVYRSRPDAEAKLAKIESLGVCHGAHEIVAVAPVAIGARNTL